MKVDNSGDMSRRGRCFLQSFDGLFECQCWANVRKRGSFDVSMIPWRDFILQRAVVESDCAAEVVGSKYFL